MDNHVDIVDSPHCSRPPQADGSQPIKTMKTRFASSLLALAAIACSAHGATVLVNEINCKSTGATPSGDWFEIVVVGNGAAYSTVDMRGWQFRIDNNALPGQGYFKLSNDSYWSNVRAGTIITFCEDETNPTGAATSILGTDNFSTLGWGHTNVFVGDTTYIDTTWALHDPGFPLDQNATQIAIQDSSGTTVFGPAGEGHDGYLGSGVSASEIFKLEENPSPSITLASRYNDGSTDTFGRPNEWTDLGVPNAQSFTAYIPEPSSALLTLGILPLLGIRRRRD